MRLGIEPKGVDFVVEPVKQTKADKDFISQVIAHYKATGEITRAPIPKVKQPKSKKELITQQ
jgi:hypothetical protein